MNVFLAGDKLTADICYNYIYTIRTILSNLSAKQTGASLSQSLGISKYWNLSKKSNSNETMNIACS